MDENDLKARVSILVLSFDGFSELWQPFFDSFFKTWPDCPFNVYLLTNYKQFDHPRVKSLQVGPDVSWSDNLIKALQAIPTEYTFMFYEDAFFTAMKKEKAMQAISYCLTHQLSSLLLMPTRIRGQQRINKLVRRINKHALYRNSLFLNLIRRDVLLQILKPGENAWQYEVIGNDRSKYFDFYCVNEDLFRYDHGIVKGKWLASTRKKLESRGYSFQKLSRSIPAATELFYRLKLTVFHWYLSLLPLSLLLWLEKKRYSDKNRYLQNPAR